MTISKAKNIIVVLGGGLVKGAMGWRTTNYDEGDNFGVSGDRAIVAAAGALYGDHSEWTFLATGGKGHFDDINDMPNISTIIKKELMTLGVPSENIIEENNSYNTYQQLLNLQLILSGNGGGRVIVLSNQHTLPRLQAMVNHKEELLILKKLLDDARLELLSAEKVLLDRDPDNWEKIITEAYAGEAMKKRVALEEQGARQIKDGTYIFV